MFPEKKLFATPKSWST